MFTMQRVRSALRKMSLEDKNRYTVEVNKFEAFLERCADTYWRDNGDRLCNESQVAPVARLEVERPKTLSTEPKVEKKPEPKPEKKPEPKVEKKPEVWSADVPEDAVGCAIDAKTKKVRKVTEKECIVTCFPDGTTMHGQHPGGRHFLIPIGRVFAFGPTTGMVKYVSVETAENFVCGQPGIYFFVDSQGVEHSKCTVRVFRYPKISCAELYAYLEV